MEDIINHFGKIISKTVMVHIYSFPSFSIEVFLSLILCVVHILLIYEVNDIFQATNAKALSKLRLKHPHLRDSDSCSYQTISRLQVFPQKIEATTMRKSFFAQPCRKLSRKMSNRSNFGWVIPRKDSSMFRHTYTDRIDQLLSITPSEYVRKDKERKNREAGLKSCIESLTTLLEKALSNEHADLHNLSGEALRKSINHIKENFENQIVGDTKPCKFPEFGDNSLHSLITNSLNNKPLKTTAHIVSFNVTEDDKSDKVSGKGDINYRDSEATLDGDNSDGSEYGKESCLREARGDANISAYGT
ncbi:uncharacterized protein LOC114336022 [Diabrotica virgifera virgifera]|uniref:BHLH domain-containing protein n=1 Tax=Diabrotica virgifera virgifera TaxID=50390 RepID=A0ABM5IU90_DIAVI|nr:uncharacterized protein LOC114336022 [Diabrotica virgifera virgifera]